MSNNITSSGALFTTSGPGTIIGDTTWGALAVNGNGNSTVGEMFGVSSALPNLGQIQFQLQSNSVANRGMAIYKDGAGLPTLGNLGFTAGWQVDIILNFQLFPIGNNPACFRAGVCASGQQIADAPTDGFWV